MWRMLQFSSIYFRDDTRFDAATVAMRSSGAVVCCINSNYLWRSFRRTGIISLIAAYA
jgi:hypothetical protein